MQIVESLKAAFVENWLVFALTGGASLFLAYCLKQILYAFGKEEALKPERRKVFYGISSLLAFCVLLFIQHVNRQLEDIRKASAKDGKFDAGLIFLGPIGTSSESEMNMPPLSMSGIGGNSNMSASGANYVLVMRVANSGQPSVAWNWKAYLRLPTGQKIDAVIPSVSVVAKGPLPTIIGPYTPKMEDNLIQSLAASPLATGAGKIGWIVVHVSGINDIPIGTVFGVTVEDVFRRQTVMEHTWAPPFN